MEKLEKGFSKYGADEVLMHQPIDTPTLKKEAIYI